MDIIKCLYQYGFRFIGLKSLVIIYKDDKLRFISLYYDKNNKYWNKSACIKCWCEADLSNLIFNIYKTEPLLNDDETIDDIFYGYDDNRIDMIIPNNNIESIEDFEITSKTKNEMTIITISKK